MRLSSAPTRSGSTASRWESPSTIARSSWLASHPCPSGPAARNQKPPRTARGGSSMVQSSRRPGLGTAGSVPRPDGCARVHTRPPTTCRPPTPPTLPRSASAASCGVSPLALLPCERSLETRRHSRGSWGKKSEEFDIHPAAGHHHQHLSPTGIIIITPVNRHSCQWQSSLRRAPPSCCAFPPARHARFPVLQRRHRWHSRRSAAA